MTRFLAWIRSQKLGRDALVVLGIVAVASGVRGLFPGADRIVGGSLVLYIALWHGPFVARLVRPRKE